VDGASLGSWAVVDFNISSVELSNSASRVLVGRLKA